MRASFLLRQCEAVLKPGDTSPQHSPQQTRRGSGGRFAYRDSYELHEMHEEDGAGSGRSRGGGGHAMAQGDAGAPMLSQDLSQDLSLHSSESGDLSMHEAREAEISAIVAQLAPMEDLLCDDVHGE